MDLVLKIQEELVEDVKAGGSLGCRDHEMVEIRILHGIVRKTRTLNIQKATMGLFKDLLIGIPWVRSLEEKGVQERLSVFKHHFSRLKTSVSLYARNQAKGAGLLHG